MKLFLGLLGVFCILLLPVLSVCAQAPAVPLSGDWSGSLSVGKTTLRLVFHFLPKPDGTITGTFDSVDQGAMGLAFSAATVTGSAVHLEASTLGASYDGKLNASGKTLDGKWTQGSISFPLKLTKTDHVPTLDRPQEPKPPFPYLSTDVTFPGGGSGVTMAGTLSTPPGAGPYPAVVLISGSGPNNRDETILGHKPFLLLADTLTRRGIAVLRYDKRGIGGSTGDYKTATTADFAQDAYGAVAFLKNQSGIDPKRIGLLGHSEGGLIVPLVASQHPADIAFVVLLAGPGMNGEKIIMDQTALIAKAEGVKASEITQSIVQQRQIFEAIKREPDPAAAQAKAQALILADMTPKDKKQLGDPVKFARKQSQTVTSPWFRYFLTYDPLPALRETHCPVLALDGSLDLQVPPAEDLALISKALKEGGNAQVTVQEFPNLNHLFQTCKTGAPSEYAKISETMSPVVLTTVSDWVAGQAGIK